MKFKFADTQTIEFDWFLISYFAFKFLLDYAFWTLLQYDIFQYKFDFSLIKWLNGFIWCSVLFFSIKHNAHLSSSFFLYLIHLTQILPLTTVYALSNESPIFYNLACFSFLLTIVVVNYFRFSFTLNLNSIFSRLLVFACIVCVLYMLIVSFQQYGLPSLSNFDLYSVYLFRKEAEEAGIDKSWSYLLRLTTQVILPAGITLTIKNKCYKLTMLLTVIMLAMFLYTGHKAFLFSLPLILLCGFFSDTKNFYRRFFIVLSTVFSILIVVALIGFSSAGSIQDVSYLPFNLIIRRIFYVPANLKFVYFDYFSVYDKLGFVGMFPRSLIEFTSRYYMISFPNEIGAIYFNAPLMFANTGYLVEGYVRFGYLGIIVEAFLLGRILQLMDIFQKRTSYGITIGFFVYSVYVLNDGFLLTYLFFGVWAFILIILLTYRNRT